MGYSCENNKREINWVFERNLSTLACHAAIELDGLLIDQEMGLESVRELTNRISNFINEIHEEGNVQYSLINPSTVVIFDQAIQNEHQEEKLENVDDFIKKTNNISAEFKKTL